MADEGRQDLEGLVERHFEARHDLGLVHTRDEELLRQLEQLAGESDAEVRRISELLILHLGSESKHFCGGVLHLELGRVGW